jgi:hypothetical protein
LGEVRQSVLELYSVAYVESSMGEAIIARREAKGLGEKTAER